MDNPFDLECGWQPADAIATATPSTAPYPPGSEAESASQAYANSALSDHAFDKPAPLSADAFTRAALAGYDHALFLPTAGHGVDESAPAPAAAAGNADADADGAIDPALQRRPSDLAPTEVDFAPDRAGDAGSGSDAARGTLKPHEVGKRKQNIACDVCRAKKVACRRTSVHERCGQCAAKGIECTSAFVEQLLAKPRVRRVLDTESGAKRRKLAELTGAGVTRRASGSGVGSGVGGTAQADWEGSLEQDVADVLADGSLHLLADLAPSQTRRGSGGGGSHAAQRPTLSTPAQAGPSRSSREKQDDLLRYLFCPTPVTSAGLWSDAAAMGLARDGQSDLWEEMDGRVWDEPASVAQLALWTAGAAAIHRLAADCLETFLAIVATRLSDMIDGVALHARYLDPTLDPLPTALLSVMLAWGAKFSAHTMIERDRAADAARGEGPARSRIAQLLVLRAREVVEASKAHRVASFDNAQALMLLEMLSMQNVPFNIASAIRHLSAVPDISAAVHLRRLVSLEDGFGAMFHAWQPAVPDWEWDAIERHALGELASSLPLAVDRIFSPPAAGADRHVANFIMSNAGAYLCRQFCRAVYTPAARAAGIATSAVRDLVHRQSQWRDTFVPPLDAASAACACPPDLAAALAAAAVDVRFHTTWIAADRVIAQLGMADDKAGKAGIEAQQLRQRIGREAEYAAMRVAALVAVLVENDVLRLDFAFPHAIYEAGLHLARRGRGECAICVLGLRQAAVAFPQLHARAGEIEAAHSAALAGLTDGGLGIFSGTVRNVNNRAAELTGYKSLPDRTAPDGTGRDVAQLIVDWLHER